MESALIPSNPAEVRRTLGWALVGSLTLAALTACVAILSGSFDNTDERVIFSSLAFSLYSGVTAAGASMRLRAVGREELLGTATVATATFSFGLFLVGLWGETGSETLWRLVGATAVTALASAHACMMLGARRRGDSSAVSTMTRVSVALGGVDASIAVLAILGAIDDVSDSGAEFFAVLLIALLLTTALAPIVRKLQQPAATAAAPAREARAEEPPAAFVVEVIEAADRIDELNGDPGIRAPEIRREVERLRRLARAYAGP